MNKLPPVINITTCLLDQPIKESLPVSDLNIFVYDLPYTFSKDSIYDVIFLDIMLTPFTSDFYKLLFLSPYLTKRQHQETEVKHYALPAYHFWQLLQHQRDHKLVYLAFSGHYDIQFGTASLDVLPPSKWKKIRHIKKGK